jgi:phage shock protein C
METKRLTRSRNEQMIAGVCGGLGEYLDVDPTWIRLAFVFLSLSGGPGLIIYVIMWLITPLESMGV